jgi:hypothetical protein
MKFVYDPWIHTQISLCFNGDISLKRKRKKLSDVSEFGGFQLP